MTGTGLGLSIAHDIATGNGGDSIAESEVGKGASFYGWFTRVDDDPESESPDSFAKTSRS